MAKGLIVSLLVIGLCYTSFHGVIASAEVHTSISGASAAMDPTPAKTVELIIWNVGQGQWATVATHARCDHFDMGGERVPIRQGRKLCGEKVNNFYLSHDDWDHISGIKKWLRVSKRSCLAQAPQVMHSKFKEHVLNQFVRCSKSQTNFFSFAHSSISVWSPPLAQALKSANQSSQIFVWQQKVLFLGDAPQSSELLWMRNQQLRLLHQIRYLVLGHHGSRTANSMALLKQLQGLRQAIVSSNPKRYGHPHQEVRRRLRQQNIPLLETSVWGNLHFQI